MRRLLFLAVVLTFGCGDEEAPRRAADGQMMVRIDGEESISTSVSARVRPATPSANPSASLEASFSSPSGDFEILLSASTQDIFKLMEAGAYVVEGEDIPLNYGIIYYAPGGIIADSYISFNVGGAEVGEIVITQIDTENKLISGTFQCTAAQKNTGDVVTITEGSFTRIPYRE